jgi:hypothetical protein
MSCHGASLASSLPRIGTADADILLGFSELAVLSFTLCGFIARTDL